MPESSLLRPLQQALGVLAQEHPRLSGQLAAALGPRRLHIAHAQERLGLWVSGDQVRCGDPPPVPHVHIHLGPSCVHSLLTGGATVEEALLGGRLDLRGELDDLLALARAVHLFAHGALRCPSMPALMQTFTQPAAQRSAS